ncbi:MAG: thermonuclease family protein [Deltaproteobacteria bacterium]|nr:thermonuclease family protein [Deltaproteobacteria bacterium]
METPVQQVDAAEAHSGAAERQKPSRRAWGDGGQKDLLIGEYRLADDPVIDGDTIRVEGIDGSLRLLSLDTEERFYGEADPVAASKDFEGYLRAKRARAARPKKFGTPMGEEAARFAEAFFEGAEVVQLERDDPKEIRGNQGRLLAYAFVRKGGRRTNYSIECVRAGMSPYFTKYGYSRRFHDELTRAEAEAREAKRGIWSPSAKGYGDYDERKPWWDARADFIRAFEDEARRRDDFIMLSHSDALERLEEKVGKAVTVLSTVDDIDHFKGLVRVSLTAQDRQRLPVIFFDRRVFRASGIEGFKGEPVTVSGTVERYKKGGYRTLQIVASESGQVGLPSLP